MRKPLTAILLLILVFSGGYYVKRHFWGPRSRLLEAKKEVKRLDHQLKDGDLIFQTSLSKQSIAIQRATKSQYSHCGLILKRNGVYYVFEAVQPVKFTPLENWIAKGQGGKFVIKRLKNADEVIIPAVRWKMWAIAEQFKGKNYDLTFEWTDDKIYCSELIWKIYQRAAGVEIGKLQRLRDFDLTNPAVKKKMIERYGDKVPLDESVISPAAIFNSELLETVKSN